MHFYLRIGIFCPENSVRYHAGSGFWSVRPNMIFTVAFDYSPLDRAQKKQVLDIVTKELLTPKGIRSLSPKSGGYNPNYVGPQIQRDYAYHQGTAWPWLMGFYLEAYLRIYKMSGLSFVERQLISYDDEMTSHCVGSIAELFDGNPPFRHARFPQSWDWVCSWRCIICDECGRNPACFEAAV